MEILDLSKYPYGKIRGSWLEFDRSRLKCVGLEPKFQTRMSANLEKQKPGQEQVSALIEFENAGGDTAFCHLKLPLSAFPDVAIDLKSSVKTFKLSRFSAFDFAFSVLLHRLAELTLELEDKEVLFLDIKLGTESAREVIDLEKRSHFRTALCLP